MTVFPNLGMSLLLVVMLGLSSAAYAAIAPETSAESAPDTVDANLVLVFSDQVDLRASFVEVRGDDNRLVETGKLKFGPNGVDVEVPLSAPLAPGNFTIEWRAVSVDGRESIGGYAFTVDPVDGGIPTLAQQTP